MEKPSGKEKLQDPFAPVKEELDLARNENRITPEEYDKKIEALDNIRQADDKRKNLAALLAEGKITQEEYERWLTLQEGQWTRQRAGVVGRAKQLGRAEKTPEGRWEFNEEFREKARREMEEDLAAKKGAAAPTPPVEPPPPVEIPPSAAPTPEPAPAESEIPEEFRGKSRKELEKELKKTTKRLEKLEKQEFFKDVEPTKSEIENLRTRKAKLEAVIAATPRELKVINKEIKKIDREIKRLEGLHIKTKPEEDRLNELRGKKQELEKELRRAEARERLKRALEYLRSLTKEELGELIGEATEESLPILLKLLEKSDALEKRAVVKMVVDTVVGNLEKLEEDKFPHIQAWKRENAAAFEGLKKDLTEALLEENEEKRNQKVKEVFTKHKIEGETLKEMNKIAGVINSLHKELKLKGALSEEEKAKLKKDVEALRGKSGELKEKLLVGAGFAGLMLLLAFFLVVILELSVIDAMLGKKHGKS